VSAKPHFFEVFGPVLGTFGFDRGIEILECIVKHDFVFFREFRGKASDENADERVHA